MEAIQFCVHRCWHEEKPDELLNKEKYSHIVARKTHTIPLRTAVIHHCVQRRNIPDSSVLSGMRLLRGRNSLRKERRMREREVEKGRATRERERGRE